MSTKSKQGSNNMGLSLRQISEGQLLKYTNMIQGWQNRWFVLDPHTGLLEYFMSEAEKKHRPRASLHLAGAIVVPSEEDSYTFTVNGANDESFKLRAVDAKERQYWINRLRVVAQAHTQVLAESNPPLLRDHSQLGATLSTASAMSLSAGASTSVTASGGSNGRANSPSQRILSCQLTVLDAFSSVRDYLRRVECEHQRLIHDIEALPASAGPTSATTCTDNDILVLKATSQATLLCLEQCLAILHYQQQQPSNKLMRAGSAGNSPLLNHSSKVSPPKRFAELTRPRSESAVSALSDHSLTGTASSQTLEVANPAGGVADDNEADYVPVEPLLAMSQQQSESGGNEEYKTRVLKLLSQLKLGTELTRVHLPVLFCEPRSLLQVLADAFSQPQILLKTIGESLSAEQRMIRVTHWYLGCFRAAQLEMTAARKPFNPILGETFKCLWNAKDETTGDVLIFRFVAEQVSHNPPVTAFHLECPQKRIRLLGSLSVKAKFMGMYASAALSGEVALELPVGDDAPLETYEMSYPTLYVRSFLSEPWMEFGGKIQLACPQTRVTAGLVFQTKPFYGGKPHQVTAEIKSSNGNTAGRLSGDWMSTTLEISWTGGQSEALTSANVRLEQKVRPLAQQAENESFKVWQHVRKSLATADFTAAGQHKKLIEDQQRTLREQGAQPSTRYFKWDNERWLLCKNK